MDTEFLLSEISLITPDAFAPVSLLQKHHRYLSPQMQSIVEVALVFLVIVLTSIVCGLYWMRGPQVVIRIMMYLIALSTMTLTVKSVYTNHDFDYPKFMTFTHFLTSLVVAFGVMFFRNWKWGMTIKVPGPKQFFYMVLPTALAFACSIGFANLALVYSNAAFVEMVSSSTPLFTVLVVLAMGIPFQPKLMLPVVLVTVGVVACATGEKKLSMVGFFFAAFASLMRALRSTLQQKMLCPFTSQAPRDERLDPIELLAWMSVPSVVVLWAWSCVSEGWGPYGRFTQEGAMPLLGAILVTCLNACVLNVSNLFVIKDLGAVACQLAGQLKSILIMLGAVAAFGERISPIQIVGFLLVVAGVFWYNRMEAKVEKKVEGPIVETEPLKPTGP